MSDLIEQPLAGRHAVVTGGGRGIGAAIAESLSRLGASLTLMGRDPQLIEAKAVGFSQAQAIRVDVADENSVIEAFAAAEAGFGPCTVLINNAGAVESAALVQTDTALWRRMLAVNLDGVFFCSRAALPAMRKENWGRVVNIASTAGLRGYAYVAAYCAAKHGVIGLTRALALETARTGITVNAVCPGYTETDLLSDSILRISEKTGRSPEQARAELIRGNPQGRLVQPREVADTVVWLCSENTTAITGQSIPVAGGEIM